MSYHRNITRIKALARLFQKIDQPVIFVGGAAISLYTEENQIPDLRTTDDVDVIVNVINYVGYTELTEILRGQGFIEDNTSEVICRWKVQGVIVDIMPIAEQALGFTNPWYKDAFDHYQTKLIHDIEVHYLPIRLYLLTKYVALIEREGGVDWRWSHDFEDICSVMISSSDWKCKVSSDSINKGFLSMLNVFLENNSALFEAIRGQLSPQFYSDDQIINLINKMKSISE